VALEQPSRGVAVDSEQLLSWIKESGAASAIPRGDHGAGAVDGDVTAAEG
jgi:hypothetical protein